MSDYISREAAKQILSRLLVKDAAECACNLVDCVLPADVEPVRRWIPCSERMPDLPDGEWAHRTVIVCARGHAFPLDYEREKVRGKTVERWKWAWNRIYEKPDSITHWMPLPEPPEEER